VANWQTLIVTHHLKY